MIDTLKIAAELSPEVRHDLLTLGRGAKARIHKAAPILCVAQGRKRVLTGVGYTVRSHLIASAIEARRAAATKIDAVADESGQRSWRRPMRTFVTSRPVAQSFTPYRVMSETVRRRMYGGIVGMDRAIASHRSAALRAVSIFVVTALRAAAAIARRGAR